jgi:hypothetical protein
MVLQPGLQILLLTAGLLKLLKVGDYESKYVLRTIFISTLSTVILMFAATRAPTKEHDWIVIGSDYENKQ